MATMQEKEKFEKRRVYKEPEVLVAQGFEVQPRDGNDNKSDEPDEPTPRG